MVGSRIPQGYFNCSGVFFPMLIGEQGTYQGKFNALIGILSDEQPK